MRFQKKLSLLAVACALVSISPSYAASETKTKAPAEAAKPWMNTTLTPEQRANLVLKELTLDEKIKLVFGHFGTNMPWKNIPQIPAAIPDSAGYVEGIPRLGIPNLYETDAGIGVATQVSKTPRERTALPSGIATAATWNLDIAYKGGAMIGSEARASGFNVMLAGGVNLLREPRNGRNFEYAGEDPLLAGYIVAEQIKGIQSNHVVSTLKHFAFNNQETGRFYLDAKIDDVSARMSDLLALQFALERSNPGSVMCAYNRFNGAYACENEYLLNEVLKGDWGFKGWVMSDWGATHSTVPAALHGLDQESGWGFDESPYFSGALKEAVENGWVPQSRMDDMVRRILWGMFANGLFEHLPGTSDIDFKANGAVTQADAEEAIVLLKNTKNLLPLTKEIKKIAVIGSHSDVGVLSGGGSSQVYPVGGKAVQNIGPNVFPGPLVYYPSSPLKAIQARAPESKITYNEGTDVKAAAKLAAESDVVVLFANQWTGESIDALSIALPDNQDALVAAVAKANSKTVVVLQTGGPIAMPWLDKVGSVLEAWYPGTSGGEAIGRVLFGEVNPSGHLPATFPVSEKQLPRPVLDGDLKQPKLRFDVNYHEGATVGYKWFDAKGLKPLFPFGHGLSYTQFAYSDLASDVKNGNLNVRFKVTNTGAVKGKDVAQVYVSPTKAIKPVWEAPKRLGGWDKVDLNPGESKEVSLVVEPRLLGVYEGTSKTWKIAEGDYTVQLAENAMDAKATSVTVHLNAFTLDVNGKLVK